MPGAQTLRLVPSDQGSELILEGLAEAAEKLSRFVGSVR
jgi:hypothetical protein